MTPADIVASRKRLGMAQNQLAKALRLGKHGGRTVRGWEIGERDAPGPAQMAIELLLLLQDVAIVLDRSPSLPYSPAQRAALSRISAALVEKLGPPRNESRNSGDGLPTGDKP